MRSTANRSGTLVTNRVDGVVDVDVRRPDAGHVVEADRHFAIAIAVVVGGDDAGVVPRHGQTDSMVR